MSKYILITIGQCECGIPDCIEFSLPNQKFYRYNTVKDCRIEFFLDTRKFFCEDGPKSIKDLMINSGGYYELITTSQQLILRKIKGTQHSSINCYTTNYKMVDKEYKLVETVSYGTNGGWVCGIMAMILEETDSNELFIS